MTTVATPTPPSPPETRHMGPTPHTPVLQAKPIQMSPGVSTAPEVTGQSDEPAQVLTLLSDLAASWGSLTPSPGSVTC